MEHGREDQLHGAAFRTDNQIDTAHVPLQALLNLSRDQQHYRDSGNAQGEQKQVETRGKRSLSHVSQAHLDQVHAVSLS